MLVRHTDPLLPALRVNGGLNLEAIMHDSVMSGGGLGFSGYFGAEGLLVLVDLTLVPGCWRHVLGLLRGSRRCHA